MPQYSPSSGIAHETHRCRPSASRVHVPEARTPSSTLTLLHRYVTDFLKWLSLGCLFLAIGEASAIQYIQWAGEKAE